MLNGKKEKKMLKGLRSIVIIKIIIISIYLDTGHWPIDTGHWPSG